MMFRILYTDRVKLTRQISYNYYKASKCHFCILLVLSINCLLVDKATGVPVLAKALLEGMAEAAGAGFRTGRTSRRCAVDSLIVRISTFGSIRALATLECKARLTERSAGSLGGIAVAHGGKVTILISVNSTRTIIMSESPLRSIHALSTLKGMAHVARLMHVSISIARGAGSISHGRTTISVEFLLSSARFAS